MARKPTAADYVIDFAKEEKGAGGGIRIKEGIYHVKVLTAKPTVSAEKETPGLEVTFVILEGKYRKKKIKDTLWAAPKAYGRFRSLLEACGKKVPSKVNLVKIATAIKGSELYIDVQDEEREGYSPRSRVTFDGFISVDDYEGEDDDDDGDDEDEDDDIEDEDEDEDEDEEDEDEDEDDDDEDEEEEDDEDEEPAPRKRRAKAKPKRRAATKKKSTAKRRKKKPVDDDDEEDEDLDELDLEDL